MQYLNTSFRTQQKLWKTSRWRCPANFQNVSSGRWRVASTRNMAHGPSSVLHMHVPHVEAIIRISMTDSLMQNMWTNDPDCCSRQTSSIHSYPKLLVTLWLCSCCNHLWWFSLSMMSRPHLKRFVALSSGRNSKEVSCHHLLPDHHQMCCFQRASLLAQLINPQFDSQTL